MTTRVQELHAMLVHSPLTLLPSAVIVDVAAAVTGDRAWDRTARALWWTAAGAGVAAGVAGLSASQEVKTETQHTRDMMVLHGVGNLTLVLGSLGIAAWRTNHRASWVSGLLGVGSLALLGYGAWLGGEMVYSHGIGVNSLTMSDAELERRSPPLFSRQAPARLLSDAVKGFGWLLNRARRLLSSPELLKPHFLDEDLPSQHMENMELRRVEEERPSSSTDLRSE